MAVALVVDDDDAIRKLVSLVLGRDGYTVQAARNGAEAIELLAKHDFDLMLLDVMMPLASASDVLRWMREHDLWTHTIIVTAMHERQLATMDLEGACGVIQKPFNIEELRTIAKQCMAGHCCPKQIVTRSAGDEESGSCEG